jgi:hypothetical protein
MAKTNTFSGDPEMVDATKEGPPDPLKLEIETQHSDQSAARLKVELNHRNA